MEDEDLEKLFDLKIEVLYGRMSIDIEKMNHKLDVVGLQVAEMDNRLDKQVAIWKWVLGVFSAIMVPIIVAIIIAIIL